MAEGFREPIADRYDRWYGTPFGRWADGLEKALVGELLGPPPAAGVQCSILDIGCGTGHWGLWLTERGYEVTGIDISESMVARARTKLGDRAKVEVMSATKLEFPDSSFDHALMVTLLEFLDDPEAVLAEAARVARKSVIVGVVNRQSMLGIWYKLRGLFRKADYRPPHFYTPGELTRIGRQAAAASGKEGEVSWSGALCLRQLLWRATARCPLRGFIGMRVGLGGHEAAGSANDVR